MARRTFTVRATSLPKLRRATSSSGRAHKALTVKPRKRSTKKVVRVL